MDDRISRLRFPPIASIVTVRVVSLLFYLYALQIISFILFSIPSLGKEEPTKINLAPNKWLHSSVGRASHRYRGDHGFDSNPVEALEFFHGEDLIIVCFSRANNFIYSKLRTAYLHQH